MHIRLFHTVHKYDPNRWQVNARKTSGNHSKTEVPLCCTECTFEQPASDVPSDFAFTVRLSKFATLTTTC
ncbi:hypothetical protein CEXT_645371 [Caerostris extrusa]|uniref:Uncharacterized protein n=1 Tax=Caerostris extrusa TaxID=172846 RepID=A0AAV4XXA0_CAEEX|nr:hypothetical protein CEXT_645371 [Caerostris extrusa]